MKKILIVLTLILLGAGYVFSAGYYGTTTSSSTTGLTIGTNATLTVADSVAANITAPLGSAAYTETTAYAPIAGAANIITVGTVATGTWNAGNVTTPLLTATSANITDTGTANVLSVTDLTVSSVANVTGVTWTGFAGDTTGNAATATTATTANALATNAAIVTDNANITGGNVTGITNFSATTANVTNLNVSTAANITGGNVTGLTSLTSNVTVITDSATANVTAAQMMGQTHVVTGAYTLSLPTAAIGYNARFFASTAAAYSIDVVTGTDIIVLNGTALTAGYKATSDGTIAAAIYCECIVAGKYICTATQGLFIDGGA